MCVSKSKIDMYLAAGVGGKKLQARDKAIGIHPNTYANFIHVRFIWGGYN